MNVNTLRKIHFTVLNRAKNYNYFYPIPSTLPSLEKENPTRYEIYKDYSLLSSHFSHPVFKDFIPTYDEKVNSFDNAWYKRYIETMYCK